MRFSTDFISSGKQFQACDPSEFPEIVGTECYLVGPVVLQGNFDDFYF